MSTRGSPIDFDYGEVLLGVAMSDVLAQMAGWEGTNVKVEYAGASLLHKGPIV